MQHGGERRSHTAKCRERILKAMSGDEEGREKMKRREEEINESFARQMERNIQQEQPKHAEDKTKSETDKGQPEGGRIPTMVGNPHR